MSNEQAGESDEGNQSAIPGPRWGRLSEKELEAIARRCAEIVWQDFELKVGRTAIRLFIFVCGAMALAGLAWLGIHKEIRP